MRNHLLIGKAEPYRTSERQSRLLKLSHYARQRACLTIQQGQLTLNFVNANAI